MKRVVVHISVLFLWGALVFTLPNCGKKKLDQEVGRRPIDSAALVETARSQLGAPYRYGGTSPRTGFDCSGFTSWVYGQHGVTLPRVSCEQYGIGRKVPKRALKPGDLVFFAMGKKKVSHVGIYTGKRRFIHAASSGSRVREDKISEKYWKNRYKGARRIRY